MTSKTEKAIEPSPIDKRHQEFKLIFDFIRNVGLCFVIFIAAYKLITHFGYELSSARIYDMLLEHFLLSLCVITLVVNGAVLFVGNIWSFVVQSKEYSNLGWTHYLSMSVFVMMVVGAFLTPYLFSSSPQ
ncbi:hypothetical protein [Vibrio antiquarius]|uniref:hypothetical protein n=1 Tax=Vibrio antiquarius (strain Ex25) TaxID=150340 RepID=UPI00265C9D06|nr:hypothetical protein [Vibrio antiquarius]MCS0045604.1 hypothetical protein [Vibrio antiquarius]